MNEGSDCFSWEFFSLLNNTVVEPVVFIIISNALLGTCTRSSKYNLASLLFSQVLHSFVEECAKLFCNESTKMCSLLNRDAIHLHLGGETTIPGGHWDYRFNFARL